MLKILAARHPTLYFQKRNEVTLQVEVIEETDDENEDDAPIISATARVDMIIEAGKRGENDVVKVLLLEHKTPGTLSRRDWTAGMSTDKNLRRNAIPIAKQTRKYMCASMLNVIGAYDSCAVVGMCLRYEDEDDWPTTKRLPMKVFYEDKHEKFLVTFLALVEMGLMSEGLI